MNRKKILICLNGQDDAQLELSFIQQQMNHPQHQIMRFHLENIMIEQLSEVSYLSSAKSHSYQSKQIHASASHHPVEQEVAIEKPSKHKRQTVFSSSIKELITESQYTDLMVIRSANFYADCSYYGQQKPLYELLKRSGCPILVLPDQPCLIQQIVLIYDGNSASLATIKELRMVLAPICQDLPITVLIPCRKQDNPISANEEKMLIEYLRLHFKDLGVHKICEESAHTIHFTIDPDKKVLIVNNNPEQTLPQFMQEEIEKLKLDQDNAYFLFLSHSLSKP